LFKKTAKLYKNPSTLDIGVGSVIFAGVELGIKRDIKVFFTGLGSEEIFAGYQRHELSKDIQEECWKGLKTMFKRDFLRDFSIAEYFNISLRLPFLDEAVILSAMGIPEKDKIKGDMKKIPIRKVAIKEGLPEEFALRKKKAAQYGSGFDKLLRKLARNAKIDKLDFIKSLKE
jgi:asparagine synthetase B (glutamine-hydrolysing)